MNPKFGKKIWLYFVAKLSPAKYHWVNS